VVVSRSGHDERLPRFPARVVTFFAGLEKNNSKEYWAANKTTSENKVWQPMQVLLTDLNGEFPRCECFDRPGCALLQGQVALQALGGRDERIPGGRMHRLLPAGAGIGPGDRLRGHGDGTRSTATFPRVARRRRQRSPIRGTDHRACRPITTGDLRCRTTTEGGAAGVPEEPSPRRSSCAGKERSSSRNMRERNGCTLPRRSAEYATSGVEQNRSRNGSTPRLGTNEEPRHIDRRPAATGHPRCAPGEFPRGSLPQPGTGGLGVGRSAGLGAGAILGGLLTTVSWRLTFAINVPLTFLGALGGARWLSSTRDRTTGHCLPVFASMLATGTVLTLVLRRRSCSGRRAQRRERATRRAQRRDPVTRTRSTRRRS